MDISQSSSQDRDANCRKTILNGCLIFYDNYNMLFTNYVTVLLFYGCSGFAPSQRVFML